MDAGLAYGKLASISIGYASKRTVSSNVLGNFTLDAWFLESVEVQDIKTGEKSVFTYNKCAWIVVAIAPSALPGVVAQVTLGVLLQRGVPTNGAFLLR